MWFLSLEWAELLGGHAASPLMSKVRKLRPREAQGSPESIQTSSTSPRLGGAQHSGCQECEPLLRSPVPPE